jgi:hypothetical protein
MQWVWLGTIELLKILIELPNNGNLKAFFFYRRQIGIFGYGVVHGIYRLGAIH